MMEILLYLTWKMMSFILLVIMLIMAFITVLCILYPFEMLDLFKIIWHFRVKPKLMKKSLNMWVYDCFLVTLVVLTLLSIGHLFYIWFCYLKIDNSVPVDVIPLLFIYFS